MFRNELFLDILVQLFCLSESTMQKARSKTKKIRSSVPASLFLSGSSCNYFCFTQGTVNVVLTVNLQRGII